MEDNFNSHYSSFEQYEDVYDLDDLTFSPLPAEQNTSHRSTTLTPLWTSWNIAPPSPQKMQALNTFNTSVTVTDPLMDLMNTVAAPDQQQHEVKFSQQPNSPTKDQQEPEAEPHNSSVLEECDLQVPLDADMPFDFDTWNLLCSHDRNLTVGGVFTSSPSDSETWSTKTSQDDFQISSEQQPSFGEMQSLKRKAASGGNAIPSGNRKKRVVSRNQQPEKKDLISCVIANLPAEVIEQQQKSIPTAFPSRMRQTRIQAAIKAQTDAMVQSCQQRIMKNSVDDLVTAPLVASQASEKDGQKYIGAYTLEERRLRIARFHEKRKQRVWHHTVKYNCRRKLAVGRVRVKGRFVKSDEDQK